MRINIISFLLLLTTGLFAQTGGTGEVIITEIHNRPLKPTVAQVAAASPNNPGNAGANAAAGDERHTEWFEIFNPGESPVVMDGWKIFDGSSTGTSTTIGTFTIEAGDYAVFSGFNIPAAQGGVVFDYFYDYGIPRFNNESSYGPASTTNCPDGVRIEDPNGILVDEVLYDYGYGFYIGNPGSPGCMNNTAATGIPPAGSSSKVSMMLKVDPAVMNPIDNDIAANWSYSTTTYDAAGGQKGTPGEVNDSPTGTGEVIITEIHNRPQKPTQAQLNAAFSNPALGNDPNFPGMDLSPDEDHVEWFEVYNTTNADIVMDGWTLTDGSSTSNSTVITSFTLLAGEYAVFSGFNIPDAQGGVVFDYFYDYKKPSFNNESSYSDPGDTACPDGVTITRADGRLVDQVLYDYGYGEYIGNPGSSSSCANNTAAIGVPPPGSSSKVSMMLKVDPAVMNAEDNDLAANWSYSTSVYDPANNQKGTPGLQNDIPVPPTGTGEVIITEIHNRPEKPTQTDLDAALLVNPPGADLTPDEDHTEWFEVYNTTGSDIVMDGWTLTDGSSSGSVTTIGSFTLPAGEYAVFSGFNIPAAQGGVVFDYFYDYKKPSFNNESSYADPGDTACPDGVIIHKANGDLVDQVLYDYGYGNYIGNPGSPNCSSETAAIGVPPAGGSAKVSMMLNVDPAVMNAADNDLAANWSYSTSVYDAVNNQIGTPGLENDIDTCDPDLILSGINTTTGVNEAEFSITSTEQIDGGALIDYSAGTEITLNPDFEVILGAVFHAYILGCQ